MQNQNKFTFDESLFYCDIPDNIKHESLELIIRQLCEYSKNEDKQIYILHRALGVKKPYQYALNNVAYILMPKHPIILLNYGADTSDELEDYFYDFKEDLGHLSDKYNYDKLLGRARKWPDQWIEYKDIENFNLMSYLENEIDSKHIRKVDLLISLLIGSINSVEKIGEDEPITILDKVKQKIVLFDGKQSSFIYQSTDDKRVVIQGMAGTGKTELLLHKLKDIYANEEDTVIAFTCFNKVLANDMRNRIPKFFNFMKVSEQIDWENRLHVFSSWGSLNQAESGMYSYVCNKYKIPFSNYKENHNFDQLCRNAIEALNEIKEFKPCFDYIFIDESQDFGEGFFKLCEKIAARSVYIAGDIFQNIYDSDINMNIKPNFLLNKCYRTDPKTLMFAHAVGMGLYETPPLNWLEDSGWNSCGYLYTREHDRFILSRSPLRRFEDLDEIDTIQLSTSEDESYVENILSIIKNIKEKNPNVQPEDLGIVILGDYKKMCTISDMVAYQLNGIYEWDSSKGYETKVKKSKKVYISNINNVKGLEFPFVICVVLGMISDNIKYRNSIYMALTRSFLTSYFIVNNRNQKFTETYQEAIIKINTEDAMNLLEPTPEEKSEMVNKIKISLLEQKRQLLEIIDELCKKEYVNISKKDKEYVFNWLKPISAKLSEEKILKKARVLIEEILEVE